MIKTNEEYIKEFHQAFGIAIEKSPTVDLLKLRKTLISEEVKELFDELNFLINKLERNEKVSKTDYLRILKEMADVQVVLSGTQSLLSNLRNFTKRLSGCINLI